MSNSSTDIDLTLLTPILEKYTELKPINGRIDQRTQARAALLPLLHEAQTIYGWLPPTVQEMISRTLRVPLADIHGVIEFYSMFYNEPTPKKIIRLCEDPACSLAGANPLARQIKQQLQIPPDATATADHTIGFERVPCLGMCEHAPVALNSDRPAGNLTTDSIPAFLNETHPEPTANIYGTPRWLTKRIGVVDPLSLSDYLTHDGYISLRHALTLPPETIISFIESSKILGRGGAMFPTGRKWRFTRGAPGAPSEKHFVVNADESEPGTFKDRCLMEEDPFALIEATTLAAFAVGAENGWIFVRGEYPRAFARLQNAIDLAREAGYLGKNILDSGFNFDIELRLGAGAYICGEETALFEAIEGKRGFPRIKPPFPTTNGLFDQPTAINNVETVVAALTVFSIGLDQWQTAGTIDSPGTKLFCLSGAVTRPGLYEVPFGTTLGELIRMAGGLPGRSRLKAILMGGAAGIFLDPSQLNIPLTYEDARTHNVPLGSGVIMLFDETADLRQTIFELSRFFAHESCGKCFPCQLGTQRQMELLQPGISAVNEKETLIDLGVTMSQTSLCGLGQTAASAVISAIEKWPELLS